MDHLEALANLTAKGLRHFVSGLISVLQSFIIAMSDQAGPSESKGLDPRLLAKGSGQEPDLQEVVAAAQEIRRTMSSGNPTSGGKSRSSAQANVSPELVAKVDSILAIVQNLQSNQREIYNYVRAMAPKHAIVRTEGPTDHLETVNQALKEKENVYLEKLRQSLRKPK